MNPLSRSCCGNIEKVAGCKPFSAVIASRIILTRGKYLCKNVNLIKSEESFLRERAVWWKCWEAACFHVELFPLGLQDAFKLVCDSLVDLNRKSFIQRVQKGDQHNTYKTKKKAAGWFLVNIRVVEGNMLVYYYTDKKITLVRPMAGFKGVIVC